VNSQPFEVLIRTRPARRCPVIPVCTQQPETYKNELTNRHFALQSHHLFVYAFI
jgi:hypothetical protein